ncbi:hypothetical protein CgunFtcFv8_012544 [Champsocephalus gunnari]|uniref:Uncharacterized protein n=1 Tax=Champsocephalus gunnari TaxID=52237 RepID=A0AAN8DS14_CHAGU|nr:hypothetical protein CgunFtcFv8_012544 [Champsocephalus gunnari]
MIRRDGRGALSPCVSVVVCTHQLLLSVLQRALSRWEGDAALLFESFSKRPPADSELCGSISASSPLPAAGSVLLELLQPLTSTSTTIPRLHITQHAPGLLKMQPASLLSFLPCDQCKPF